MIRITAVTLLAPFCFLFFFDFCNLEQSFVSYHSWALINTKWLHLLTKLQTPVYWNKDKTVTIIENTEAQWTDLSVYSYLTQYTKMIDIDR